MWPQNHDLGIQNSSGLLQILHFGQSAFRIFLLYTNKMSKTKKYLSFFLFYEVILTWQDTFIISSQSIKIGELVDRSYFFSNQEGSAFPVDCKSFCKSFVEAMYNGSGILRGTGRQSSARNRRPRPRSRKSLSPSLFASWTFDNLGRR